MYGAGGQFDGFGTNSKIPTNVNLNGVTVSLTVSYGNSGDGKYSSFVGRKVPYGNKTTMEIHHPDTYSKRQRQPFPVISIRATHNDSVTIHKYISNEN